MAVDEDLTGGRDLVDVEHFEREAGLLASSGRNMILSSFSRVTHGLSRLFGFLVCVISIVPGGAEARMRPIVSFCGHCQMRGERGKVRNEITGRSLFENQFVTRFMGLVDLY